jgi:hypothetical protein
MPVSIPNYGVPQTPGVKAIKVAKIDNQGNDLTSILANLQSITFTLNGNPMSYTITSRTEYIDYFLFFTEVDPTDISAGFGPYVYLSPAVEGFVSSDYDVTYGYADFPQFSSKFMDVDYGWIGGINTPVNFYPIISGTADRAAVQDSNYASYAWSNIRYNGSRISSQNFNIPF